MYDYHEGRAFCLLTNISKAGPNPLMYHGASADNQRFDAPYQLDKLVLRASDDSGSNDVSVENSATDGEGPKGGHTMST